VKEFAKRSLYCGVNRFIYAYTRTRAHSRTESESFSISGGLCRLLLSVRASVRLETDRGVAQSSGGGGETSRNPAAAIARIRFAAARHTRRAVKPALSPLHPPDASSLLEAARALALLCRFLLCPLFFIPFLEGLSA